MNLIFYKYQGTGNDFVIVDNRLKTFPKKNTAIISHLCDRHFGIGADGLILLEDDEETDFKMVYFNADGNESTMCGNGGRCIVAFAKQLELIGNKTTFMAVDGLHSAAIKEDQVSLQMKDVDAIEISENYTFLDTGSPHHVQIVNNLDDFLVVIAGRKLRNAYGNEGSNINFVEKIDENYFDLRTYERGVEDETLACGTGATAAAIAMHKTKQTLGNKIGIKVVGGELEVSFDESKGKYTNVFLKGPATFVFKGEIPI
ncbi:diaminopimelate epimerase [uncultured Polaribacter sp.]|uniref:diaminopimelate epimerase n=1 Tax=uncultured Polaribacter sp. TaxID=174711 RepID=UPI002635DBEC|nr:diaminopimelate epimerase [uncultured Polaribacter sp.]